MNAYAIISTIKAAGFSLAADGDDILVTPPGQLSANQRQFLCDHKPDLLAALRSPGVKIDSGQGGNDLHPANDQPTIIVECWTPSGIRRLVYADSPEHADWIRTANPKPPMVTCADCDHATITSGIARCGAGVDSGLATGGWWATDLHFCGQFDEVKS